MTAPHPPRDAPEQPPAPGAAGDAPAPACPNCGAPLRPGQDWCLSCGEAVTTHVAGAPGWRTPVAIVGVVLALAAAALVVAFLELSDDAERDVAVAPTPTATAEPGQTATEPVPSPAPGDTQPLPSPDATEPDAPVEPEPTVPGTGEPSGQPPDTPTSSPGEVGEWPAGETAYTVILASESSRAAAEEKAERFTGAGRSVGILDSDDFSSLNPGYFVVFHGQYDDLEAARDAAAELRSLEPDAYARRVEPR